MGRHEHAAPPGGRSAIATAALLALALGAAGCGASRGHGAATPAGSRAAAWHQVVLCARRHGMANLPDPRIDANGQAHFPPSVTRIPAETRRACQSLYDRLIPPAPGNAPTRAQLDSLLQFARCMRSHGVFDWPDPSPDGVFRIGQRLQHLLKSAIRRPLSACEHFNPDPNGRLEFQAAR